MPQIGPELASIIREATDKLDECASNNYGHFTAVNNQLREIANEVTYSRTMHHETVIALLSENLWLGVTEPESGACLSAFDAARESVLDVVEDALVTRLDEIKDEWRTAEDEDEDATEHDEEDGERDGPFEEQWENEQFETGGVFPGYEYDDGL